MSQETLPFYENSQDSLRTIRKMGAALQELEKEKLKHEQKLEEINSNIKRIQTETLPDLMEELGIDSLKLADGTEIKKALFYSASIPDERWAEFVAWAENTRNDAMIKREIRVEGTRHDKSAFEAAQKLLKDAKIQFKDVNAIHHATLKSLVKELYEKGQKVPDCIKHYVGSIVKFSK